MKKGHREEFLTHLNSVDKNIQFTSEEPGPEGALPFLDILITPDDEGRLNISVYRKPNHTDQYLHWDSLHPISSKYSVVVTLHYFQQKVTFRFFSLILFILISLISSNNKRDTKPTRPEQPNINQPHIVVPYHQGLSENFKRTCSKHGCMCT